MLTNSSVTFAITIAIAIAIAPLYLLSFLLKMDTVVFGFIMVDFETMY